MIKENTLKKIKFSWLRYRSVLISVFIMFTYVITDFFKPITNEDLSTTSINFLSILFGFNMVVVTHYYTNSNFNEFLKKIKTFNSFKNKYKRIMKTLVLSLITIYIIILFENMKYCFYGIISLKQICNYVVIFLSLLNLIKAYDCVIEFFNVYGSTYSNTLKNINND